jgi:urease accessory protein
MAQRMGAKLVDLCRRFVRSEVLSHWGDEVRAGRAPGCYAVGQAVLFAAAGLDEKALFCALRYGQLCQLLSAALRLMRVSHFETQQLLARFAAEVDEDYTALLPLELDDVATFAPMLEVRAAQHEVGTARLFSN